MKIPFLQKSLVLAISAVLSIGASSIAFADSTISMDGTTGVVGAKNLSGPGAIIIEGGGDSRVGTVNGSNLFFSFDKFGIGDKAAAE